MGQKNTKSGESKGKSSSTSRKGGTDGRTRRKHSPGSVDEEDNGGSGGTGPKYTSEEISEMERKFNEQMKKEVIDTEKSKMSKYGRRFSIALKQPPYQEQPAPEYQAQSPSQPSFLAATSTAFSAIDGANTGGCDDDGTGTGTGTSPKREKSRRLKRSERKKANRASMPPSTAALLELRFGEEARKELEIEQKMHQRHHQHHHSGSGSGSGMGSGSGSGIQRKSASPARFGTSPPHSGSSSLSPMEPSQVAFQSSSSISPQSSSSPYIGNNIYINNSTNSTNNNTNNNSNNNNNTSINNNNNSSNSSNNINDNSNNSINEKRSWGRRRSHTVIKKPEKQEKAEKSEKPEKPEKPEKSSKKKLQWHRSSILITTSEISNYNSSLSGAGAGGGGSSFTPSSLSSSSNSPAVGLQPPHPQVSQLNLAQVQQQNQLQNSGNSSGSAAANGGNETPGKRRWLRFGRRNSRVVSTEFSREYLQNTLDSYAQQPPSSSPRPSLTNSPATYTISQPQSSRQRSKGGDLGAGVSPPTADRLSSLSSSGSKSRGYSEMPPSALSQQEFKPDGQVESPRFKKADSPTLKPSATATSSSSSSSSSLMNRATRKRSNSTILAKYHKKGSQQALAIPSDQQRQHSQSQEPKTIMSLPHKSYLSSSLQQIQADKQSQSQTQLQPQSQSQQSYHHHYDQSLEGGSGSGSNGSGGGSGAGGSGSSNDTATHHRQRSKTISSLRHSMHLQKHQKQPSPSDHTSSPQASSSPLSHLHEQPQTQPQQQQSQIQSQQHQHQHLHQQQQQEEEEELSSSQQSQSSSRHSYHQHQQAPKPELPSMLIQQRSPLMESCGDTSTDIQSAEKDDDDDGAIVSPSPPTPQLQQSPTQKPKYQLQLQQLQLQQLQLQQQQQQHTLHAKTPSTSSSSSSATTASIPPVPSPIAATPSQLSALSPGTVTLNVPSLPSPPSPRKMTPETTMLPTPTTQNAVSPPFQSSSATSAFLKKPKTKPKLKKLEVSPTTTLFPTANERGITPPSPSSPLSPSSASSALSSSSAYVAQIPLQQPPPLVLPRFRVPKVPQAPVRAGSQAGSISPSPVTQSPPSSGGLSKLPYYRHKSNLSKMSIASTRSSSASTMVSDYESSAAESDTCSTASSYLGSTVASSSSSSSSSSTSSSSSSSSSSTISGIGADGSVVSRSGYGEESDAMSFESVSTTSSFVPAQIVKKEQEKKSKRSHRCANNGTYRATLFSDTQPYKVAKSLNPQSNNLSLVQVRYEKEGDSAASSLWTFAVDPECTGYDLCLSVLQTDPATQTMAMMRARKGMDVRALASLGVRLYKVDESDISQSQLQSHSYQSKSQRNSKSDKPKEGESNAVVIINNANNDDDDDNNDDEFDPSAPNVTQVPPGDRIAAHTSSWKSGRDGYFVVYDTSKVFTPTSPTNTVRGDSITLGGPTSSSSNASNSKKASPAILVDMRTGSSSGEQTSEAWIPEEDIFWVSRISSGSFSRVYKGIYKGKYVAIKILKGGLCARNIDEFRKEFRVMKSVRHQNLLECYGASFEHNKLSYVIEYCQRGTLLHVMTDPSLKIGWDHAADFFAQALRGLQFLHEHDPPIVHRDLKSQNLLVTRSYEIKIGDFGLSRFNTASNNPTLSNMCGTMTHCAPEIFSGDLFTPKADIYSMGMILWELCTRVATGSYAPPYSEYPNIVLDIQIIAQAATKHLRPTIPASVPKKFADLIARCWDKDPEVRPDTAELLRIVEEFPQKRMSLFNRPNRKFSSLNANKKRSVRNPNSDTLASNSSTSSSQNSHSSAFPPVTPPPPLPPPVNPGGSNSNTPVSTSTGPSNTSYSTSSSFPMSTPSPQLPSHL